MKKARIMLATIAVLGLVGGTLAFKAQKFFNSPYLYAIGTTACNSAFGFTSTPSGGIAGGFVTTTNVRPAAGFTYVFAVGKYCTSTIFLRTELGE